MKKVNAKWMGDQYVITNTGTADEWYSTDGNSWVNQNAKPLDGSELEGTKIVLCGGPRDGETVA